MSTYYIAGLPCSDELYHHGVRGQKWGVRRYQYEDRTLTPLGKVHYAAMKAGDIAKKAGSAIKSGAKKAVNRQVMNIKKKHPWMMTDEELEAFTKRLNLENAYKQAMSKAHQKEVSKGKQFVGDVLRESGKRLILSGIDRWNDSAKFKQQQVFKSKEKEVKEKLDSGEYFRLPIFNTLVKNKNAYSQSESYANKVKNMDLSGLSNDELNDMVTRYDNLRILEGKPSLRKKK